LFLFVILANIFGLLLDWILLITNPDLHLANYLRPVNSDPNTTFAMSVSVVLLSHIVMIKTKWFWHYLKGYLFDFRWKWFEKIINLFVGWLHLISEFVKMLSLSLRLFGNIFAWIILISIMAFLWGMISIWGLWIWEFFVLPFWCFELFVAFIQAVVFFILPSVYFKQATELEH
jgi:F-type H+-transporting ATPase subunit a